MTKVIFRVHNVRGEEAEVVALFPELPGDYYGNCICYAHMGQHSTATLDYYRDCTRPAQPSEYKDLLAELVAIGYDDLQISQRMTPGDLQKRKAMVEYISDLKDDYRKKKELKP